jgi:ABC-type phosphate/phosphonate transport system substrate-binding protein
MNRLVLVPLLLASACAAPAFACGESMFNTGKGLEFQAYLAPRPATVVIYGTPDPTTTPEQRQALLDGLKSAGHRVVVVADAEAYAQALQAQKVDLVIADADAVNALAAANGSAAPRLVPVLARGASREVRNRFELFVRGGAGLGQYLRAIDRAVAGAHP